MDRLLTRNEVLEILAVGDQTLRRMLRRGEFPQPVRVGRQLRWHPAQIREWLRDETEDSADWWKQATGKESG